MPDLNERERRRFANLIEAHAALSRAFGRVALTVDRRRAFVELDLSDNPMAYEVMLILFNAHATRRTIAELPHLAAKGELPALESLRVVRDANRFQAESSAGTGSSGQAWM